MTVIERVPNAAAATRKVGRAVNGPPAERGAAASGRAPSDGGDRDAGAGTATAHAERYEMYGDPKSSRRLKKVVAGVNAQSASIVGITGARPRVGVSVTSRQLAGAFADFGNKALLVDLSGAEVSGSASAALPAARISFKHLIREVRPSLAVVDFVATPGLLLSLTLGELRAALAEAVQQGYTIVVDLPPVMEESGQPTPSIAAAAAACDLVFLVCLSGETKRAELTECVETCGIMGLKISGLILNDWRLPANRLLES